MEQDSNQELPFQAVFPDSNLFLPGWPDEPTGLAELVSNTGLFDIPVYLLEPVEIELEAHQIREAKGTIGKIEKFSRGLNALVRHSVKIEPINWDEFRSELRAKACATKLKLGLRSGGFPSLQLRDFFEMAVNHEHPFAEEGKNFQDAVILRSAIEVSRIEGLKEVAFVSKNGKDFDSAACSERAKERGLTLRLYKSLDALHQALWPNTQAVFKRAWEDDNQLAEQAVNLVSRDLEDFLRSQFVHTADVELELLRIGGVQTAWWDRVTNHQHKAAFRLIADVKFTITIPADDLRRQSEFSSEIERGVTVEGWAFFADGKYENVQFESAFLSR